MDATAAIVREEDGEEEEVGIEGAIAGGCVRSQAWEEEQCCSGCCCCCCGC